MFGDPDREGVTRMATPAEMIPSDTIGSYPALVGFVPVPIRQRVGARLLGVLVVCVVSSVCFLIGRVQPFAQFAELQFSPFAVFGGFVVGIRTTFPTGETTVLTRGQRCDVLPERLIDYGLRTLTVTAS